MSASTEKKNRQAAREAGTDRKTLAAQEEAKKKAKSDRRWTLGTIGVILLIAAILLLNSGLLYKTTAYTVGDTKYSAAEMNYYYANQYFTMVNQYGSYASMFGLDTSTGLAGLKDSPCAFSDGSWKDYFLQSAETNLTQVTALTDYAAANGIALDESELSEVEAGFEGMDDYAKLQGYASLDNLFAANYGAGVNTQIVREASQKASLASKALQQVADGFEYSPEQLSEQYAGYNGDKDMFSYDYYYVAAATTETTDAEGNTSTEVSPEALAQAQTVAAAIESAYKAGEGEDYLERLNQAVDAQAPGESATEQENIPGSSLGDYKDWMTDASRAPGDIAVTAQSSGSGYYVTVYLDRSYNDYPVAQVRHILIKAVADDSGAYTDEAKAEAKTKAESVLQEWKDGEMTEDSFAALAEQYSEDSGSNANGGLYDSVYKGQMVEQFDAFCFGDHKAGDTAIVYGESGGYAGYHVMYYVGQGENYCDYLARTDLEDADLDAFLQELEAGYTTAEGFGMRLVG